MTPTGIDFIDDLRQKWSAGAVTRDDALERLLPWEDDLASRTQQELEAAWALRLEIESGGTAGSHPNQPSQESTAPSPPAEQAEQATDAEAHHMLADLRANPLISLHDIVAARALCARFGEASVVPGDEYVRTRCDEVEAKVKSHLEIVQQGAEEATRVLQEAPDIQEKLRACERLRKGLGDIEMLHPEEPTLPDMVAWCEQTHHELLTLLAERDLLLADAASLTASGANGPLDIGLVESAKQRLIIMSDTLLAKDDTGFRQAAKDLAAKLNEYLSSRLSPGTIPDKQATAEYAEVLRLAKQAPEAIDAGRAKTYGDLLAETQAELAGIERGSEPPARTIPSTPPPQPKSTTGSQPSPAVMHDDVPQTHTNRTPSTQPIGSTQPGQPGQGSVGLMPPPPPPRVQPGMGTVISSTRSVATPVTHPVSAPPGTAPMPWSAAPSSTTMPTSSTSGLPSYPQPAPGYAPTGSGLRLSPAVWASIAVGIIAVILVTVLVVVLATNRGGGGGGGGNSAPADVARTFYQNLQAHNYQGAYGLLTTDFANRTSAENFRLGTETLEAQQGAIRSIDVSNVRETGDTAEATVTVTYASGNRSVEQFSLQKVGNRWLISNVS